MNRNFLVILISYSSLLPQISLQSLVSNYECKKYAHREISSGNVFSL